jgi:hypothetical protein
MDDRTTKRERAKLAAALAGWRGARPELQPEPPVITEDPLTEGTNPLLRWAEKLDFEAMMDEFMALRRWNGERGT